MKNIVDINTIRTLLIKLKKEKLFPTFYLACSNAFGQSQSPRTELIKYFNLVLDIRDIDILVNEVRYWRIKQLKFWII